jgi:hypothetical protein
MKQETNVTNKEIVKEFIEAALRRKAKKAKFDVRKYGLKRISIATPYKECIEKGLAKKVNGRYDYPITDVKRSGKQRNSDVTGFTLELSKN